MSDTEILGKPQQPNLINPYLEGVFAPVAVETTAFDLPVTGAIPRELNGRLLRIGPNPIGAEPASYHWFTGSGMAHGLRLRDGKAEWYRNRYIVAEDVAAKLGRPNIDGPRNGFGPGNANTNIIEMGGRIFATVEAGSLPVELTGELESVARSNLDGSLAHGFAAHPKLDGITGELHAIAYQPGLQAIQYLVIDKVGRSQTIAEVPAPHCPMIHDIGITRTWAIILDLPADFSMPMAMAGTRFPFAWNPDRAPRIGLLPRNGDLSGLRWIEAPSCFVFHVMNAFDDPSADAVVIDVVRHPKTFATEMRGPNEGAAKLVRWRIDLVTGRLSETVLDENALEFPRFNDAHGGLPYRFGYTAAVDGLRTFGKSYKHDVTTGRNETHDFGLGRAVMEPVFVARQGAVGEDDGWLMYYVHDANRDACDVIILDAANFADKPVAVVKLPVRVPFGFHGNWIADR